LLTITCAGLSLGCAYYCTKWSAKAAEYYNFHRKRPLSERLIRVMGWSMLAIGLLLLYAGILWIIEALA
jgi:hypothetical protein